MYASLAWWNTSNHLLWHVQQVLLQPRVSYQHGEVCAKIYNYWTCNNVLARGSNTAATTTSVKTNEVAKYYEHKCYIQWKEAKGGICGFSICTPGSSTIVSLHRKIPILWLWVMQDTRVREPNLLKVHDFKDKWVFYDNDRFCKWLISKEHEGYTCIAHYVKRYDAHFILQYWVDNKHYQALHHILR